MFYRDTWVEVDLDRIAHNVSSIKRHSGYQQLFAVVKANAYGHGDVEVARAALEAGATHLSVAFLDEALKLRRSIKNVPILVMGPIRPSDAAVAADNQIDVTAHTLDWIQQIAGYQGATLNVHLKMDSGMHRIGMSSATELQEACRLLQLNRSVKLTGIFTHFATADCDADYYQQQLANVDEMTAAIDMSQFELVHESNSAALLHHSQQPHTNCGRLGIAMYGLAPGDVFDMPVELQQAMSLHSRITQVKTLKKGEKLGYGVTFEVSEDTRIGTIAIGYADGWLRYHQNRPVQINGNTFKVVGRVCMDQCMVTIDDSVKVGDRVDLLNDQCTIDMAANDLNTINYEIVCSISDRIPRVYKHGGQVVGERNDRFR